MSQGIDPAVWETKLRKLLCKYNGSSNLDSLTAAEFQMCNTLGRLLARDDEVELHPISYRDFKLRLKRRQRDYSYELSPSLIVEAVAKHTLINENALECEEVTDG